MIRCPGCGATLADGRTSCPSCGTRLNAGRTAEIEDDVAAALAALSVELGGPAPGAERSPTQVKGSVPQTLFGRRGASAASAESEIPHPVLQAGDVVPETIVLRGGARADFLDGGSGFGDSVDAYEGTAFGIGVRNDPGSRLPAADPFGVGRTPGVSAGDDSESSGDWMEQLARSFDEDSGFESGPPVPGGRNARSDSAFEGAQARSPNRTVLSHTAPPPESGDVDAYESTDPGFGIEQGGRGAKVRTGSWSRVGEPEPQQDGAGIVRRRGARSADRGTTERRPVRRDPRLELDDAPQAEAEPQQQRRSVREQFKQTDDRTHDRSPARRIARRGVAPGEAPPDAAWDFVAADSIAPPAATAAATASAATGAGSGAAVDTALGDGSADPLAFAFGDASSPAPASRSAADAALPAAFMAAAGVQANKPRKQLALPPLKVVIAAVVGLVVVVGVLLAWLLSRA